MMATEDQYLRWDMDRPLVFWPPVPGSDDERIMLELRQEVVPLMFLPPPQDSIDDVVRRVIADMDGSDD
jgi:hypothetical protein